MQGKTTMKVVSCIKASPHRLQRSQVFIPTRQNTLPLMNMESQVKAYRVGQKTWPV